MGPGRILSARRFLRQSGGHDPLVRVERALSLSGCARQIGQRYAIVLPLPGFPLQGGPQSTHWSWLVCPEAQLPFARIDVLLKLYAHCRLNVGQKVVDVGDLLLIKSEMR